MKHFIIVFLFALNFNALAQDADKTVTLVVSGSGKTQDEAKQIALRSAIEQAFGAFISSKTEILNDNLVKDEIVSVTNGNIQKFEVLSEIQLPEGGFATTLNATVSLSKLTSFVESKGVEVEFKGDLLSTNIQLIEMNEASELVSMENLVKISNDWLKKCFDDSLITSEPINANGRYQIKLTVFTLLNSNFIDFNKYITNTLKSISMNSSEISKFDKLQIKYHKVQILNSDKSTSTFYFRNKQSLFLLINLFNHPEIYLQSYSVSNNLDVINGAKFQKVIRSDQRSTISKEWKNSAFVVKYKFFDVKICHNSYGDAETEYFYCTQIRNNGYNSLNPQKELLNNRFPLMWQYLDPGSNYKETLAISFFCPIDNALVSVRQFDYFFDKEKIKNISKFEVKRYNN
jgi:hypothetical protein